MQTYNQFKLKKDFGALVASRRKAMGLSQEELAERLSMQIRSLSKIENGHTFVTAETLCKMCNVFNLSPMSFFDFENDNKNLKINEIVDKIKSCNEKQLEFYYKFMFLIDEIADQK